MMLVTDFLELWKRGLSWGLGTCRYLSNPNVAEGYLSAAAARNYEGLCLCGMIPLAHILTKSQSTYYPHCTCLVLNFRKKKSCSDLVTWRGVVFGELCVAQERKPSQKGCFIGDEVARSSVMLRRISVADPPCRKPLKRCTSTSAYSWPQGTL